ncbi:hypothetical protein GCM10009651_35810 [Microbacterium natoriense]
MNEPTSIRDEIAVFFRGLGLTDKPAEFGDGIHGWRCEHPDRYGACDCFEQAITDLLASPVIRRIQAEAIRRASREFEFWLNAGGPTPGTAFLDRLADQIEKGSSDV